jgi:hypothetical protein
MFTSYQNPNIETPHPYEQYLVVGLLGEDQIMGADHL